MKLTIIQRPDRPRSPVIPKQEPSWKDSILVVAKKAKNQERGVSGRRSFNLEYEMKQALATEAEEKQKLVGHKTH
jgi:hypothetical protein